MKNFTLPIVAALLLAWFSLHAIELQHEEREEIEEAGIELAEQLDEARDAKAELSEELQILKEEGEEWEAGTVELELHNMEQDMVLLEKLLTRHDALMEVSRGDDPEAFHQHMASFHRDQVHTELRRELNELTMHSKRLRRELGHLAEEGDSAEAREAEQDLAMILKALNTQEELVDLWAKAAAGWEAGNEESAERLDEEFWTRRDAVDFEREQSHLERELVRIEHQQAELRKEAQWLEKRRAILSRTIGSHRKLAEVRKQVLRAHREGDEGRAEEMEETLERLTERFHIENELRHLRLELHFAEREHGAEEEVAELREAIRELSQEWEELQD